jgi:hypothetical protein
VLSSSLTRLRSMTRVRFALKAGAWHLLASGAVASAAALVVFLVWYPTPYAAIAGGFGLFALLMSVDTVLGPTLTALVASPTKPKAELRRDIALIIAVQLGAFAYGMNVIAQARPVFLSFEVDRMRVVTAADIEPKALASAPVEWRNLPWNGPKLIAAVKATNSADMVRSVTSALGGSDISTQPDRWRTFASQQDAAWRVARPVAALLARYPEESGRVEAFARQAGQPTSQLRWMPVLSRRASWVVLIAPPKAEVVGYLPIDGFF